MKIVKWFLVSIFFGAFILSCIKSKAPQIDILNKTTLSGKWVVSGSGDFKSFEFNESGNYIIIKDSTENITHDQYLFFGFYTIIDYSRIILYGFGEIHINEINEETISFTFNSEIIYGEEVAITARKQEEIEDSPKTNLLCNTWQLASENGETHVDTSLYVLFSKTGSCFYSYSNAYHDHSGGVAQWKWKDSITIGLQYSWEESSVWHEDNFVEIPILNLDSLNIVDNEKNGIFYPVLFSQTYRKTLSESSIKSVKRGFFHK